MRTKISTFLLFALAFALNVKAQEIKELTLTEAVALSLSNSNEVKLADTKIKTAESELNSTKNLQYPDVSLSGQYRYLTGADVTLAQQIGGNGDEDTNGPAPQPKVDQLLLGQANVSLPLFSGFKLKNTIEASENKFKAANYLAENDKQNIALQTIVNYLSLYKARKTVTLVEENLKSAQQRVLDFTAMEENGLLARNDRLKASLQEANIQISLEEAKKNERILNYKLAKYLQLPENTTIQTSNTDFGITPKAVSTSINRNDLLAIQSQKEAAKNFIEVEKSSYYPTIGLVGGYAALDLNNAITVKNAVNVGVALSYNLADIFKTKSDVRLAESRAEELDYNYKIAEDNINIQVENAKQEYDLILKKNALYLQSEEQAIENYRIVKDKYDNGLSDTNDLLEADVQQLQSKINLEYSKADISQKYYELLTAEGVLTNQFKN